MFNLIKNNKLYKDYETCRFAGYDINILRKYYDKTFIEICCQGPSNGKICFEPNHCSPFARVFHFEYKGECFYYKSFLLRKRLELFKDIFRGSRAERALKGHLLLQEKGFNAPCISMIGVKGRCNFLVSRGVKGASAYKFFEDMSVSARLSGNHFQKRSSIDQLGNIIGRLHKLGISHGDLRLGNIFIETSDSCQPRFFFLDNERTIQYKKLPQRKRLKNLIQLNIYIDPIATNTDRLRFFRSYLKENSELIPMKKKWLIQIINKTGKRVAKRARRHTVGS